MTEYYIELQGVDIDGDGDNDNIQYEFQLIQNLSDTGEIPFTTIEADQPLNNQALGFSGKSRKVPIEFLAANDDTDKSRGTWSGQIGSSYDDRLGSDIKTVEDQIIYLQKYIQNPTLGAQWRLFGGKFTDPDGDGTDEGTPAALQNLDIRRRAGQQYAEVSVRLVVAQVI